MKLVIVESPKKCETIRRYLGEDYIVMASQGHIRDLSTRGKGGLGIDIESGFRPDYVTSPRKGDIIAKLKSEAKRCDEVFLATDPDREGEAISWHLAQVLGLPVASTPRLRFHEITRPAITEALAHVSTIDENLVKAQEARRMEDRIIGFRVSTLLQRNIGSQSAGRVQSATLSLIVDRQEQIDAFVPEEYWAIGVSFETEGKTYSASLSKVDGKAITIHSKEEADAIVARIPQTLRVASVSKAEKVIAARPPFTTSTMQQEAYSKFHFSNSRTQAIAQRLYEGKEIAGEHVGLITYMRTDSIRISPAFYFGHAKPFIEEAYGPEYVGPLREGKKGENIQDAHEAIRPTGTHRTPSSVASYLTPDEAKLYRLIYCRAMASLMAPKRAESTTVTLVGGGLEFTLKGDRTLFPGYEAIYGEFEEKGEKSLPAFAEGAEIARAEVSAEQKFTKPEPPYNEASIVKAMEEYGIGRPSTYATTIDTLIKRKYVTSAKGVLTPTDTGKTTIRALREYFPDIVSTDYTAEMEKRLDAIEDGSAGFLETMDAFYDPFEENYEKVRATMKKAAPVETGEMCPLCGAPLVIKKSKKGDTFVGCSAYPKCTYVKKDKPEAKPTGEMCPDCGAPLIYKKNKKGETFIGCSAFPQCRFTKSMDGKPVKKKAPQELVAVKPCPRCKTGMMVVKQGKRAKFLGCTNFPRCRNIEWLPKGEEKPDQGEGK